jgi:ribosomal-protein-serine acetyltransferase
MAYPSFEKTIIPYHIRQFRSADASALFRLVDDNRERLRRRRTWVDRTRSVADSQAFIAAATRLQQANGAPTAGIWHGEHLIGTISLHPIDWDKHASHFGYWLDEHYEGQGIITRAAAALRDFAFQELGLQHLEIVCAPANHASQAVARKLGFVRQPGTQVAIWSHDPSAQMVVFAARALTLNKR